MAVAKAGNPMLSPVHLFVVLTCAVALSSAVSHDNRLGKWLQLDRVLQTRMFVRLEGEHEKARAAAADASGGLAGYVEPPISVAWAYVQQEVCLKGGSMFLAHVKSSARCAQIDDVRKSGRRACKAAGLQPGDLLLSNCTAAFVQACPAFFSVPGQALSSLCDEVGMGRYVPPSRKEDPHYEL